jgi:hypothetical protein
MSLDGREKTRVKVAKVKRREMGCKSETVLVSNQFSPGASSRHRRCSCFVIVRTAYFIYAFNSTSEMSPK